MIFSVKLSKFCFDLLKNGYSGFFEVADYEYKIKISKFKMTDQLNNFMSFFMNDYFMWMNSVQGSVYSKMMYLDRINIIEKIYANKFQLESSKK